MSRSRAVAFSRARTPSDVAAIGPRARSRSRIAVEVGLEEQRLLRAPEHGGDEPREELRPFDDRGRRVGQRPQVLEDQPEAVSRVRHEPLEHPLGLGMHPALVHRQRRELGRRHPRLVHPDAVVDDVELEVEPLAPAPGRSTTSRSPAVRRSTLRAQGPRP